MQQGLMRTDEAQQQEEEAERQRAGAETIEAENGAALAQEKGSILDMTTPFLELLSRRFRTVED